MNKEIEKVSYQELARRVGDCVMANNIMPELQGDYEFELFNGSDSYCYKHDHEGKKEGEGDDCDFESYDIYQYYIITESGAEYLKRNTDEIIYHCDKLDIYLWGITHFGTSWSGVFTSIVEKE